MGVAIVSLLLCSVVTITPNDAAPLRKHHITPHHSLPISLSHTNTHTHTHTHTHTDDGDAEGEERIERIMRRINDLKAVYMELKSELNCLDRRRRKCRSKEKDGV